MKSALGSALQQEYYEQTNMRILEATAAIISEAGEDRLTMAAVAERAKVGERTVYRHFDTREHLLEEVWRRLECELGFTARPNSLGELLQMPLLLFPRLDEKRDLVRAYLQSQNLRQAKFLFDPKRRDAIMDFVKSALSNSGVDEAWRRAGIIELLISPYAWYVVRESWTLDGFEAGRAVHEALQVLLGQWDAE